MNLHPKPPPKRPVRPGLEDFKTSLPLEVRRAIHNRKLLTGEPIQEWVERVLRTDLERDGYLRPSTEPDHLQTTMA